MAEQLDIFKKSFDALKKEVSGVAEEIDKSERLMGQTTGIVSAGVKEIGLRIQELKDGGTTGKTIKDFMDDKEVKQMYASAQDHLKTIGKDITKMSALQKGKIQQLKKDYRALRNDMTAEIAKRKKSVSTKLGTGNKSLPDMEKLLKQVNAYEDSQQGMVKIEVFQAEDLAAHERQFEDQLAKQIASTRDSKVADLSAELQKRGLDPRIITGKFNRAKTLSAAVVAECKQVDQAVAQRDNRALLTAKASLRAPYKELTEIAEQYRAAIADSKTAKQLKDDDDGAKILKVVAAIVALHGQAATEVRRIANLRLDE